MADPYAIQDCFRCLGWLYGAEQAEADDQGVALIDRLFAGLRDFTAHEKTEHASDPAPCSCCCCSPCCCPPAISGWEQLGESDRRLVREGSYQLPDGRSVYYSDAETLRDVADLYAVIDEQYDTGTPNLENDQARLMLETLGSGAPLEAWQVQQLTRLMDKYAQQIQALRTRPDRGGQDFLAEAPADRVV